ncbi:hypothetical protein [Lacunimicrobium album]
MIFGVFRDGVYGVDDEDNLADFRRSVSEQMGIHEDSEILLTETYPEYVERILEGTRLSQKAVEKKRLRLLTPYDKAIVWKRKDYPEMFAWLNKESTVQAIESLERMSNKSNFFWPCRLSVPDAELPTFDAIQLGYLTSSLQAGRLLAVSAMLDAGEARHADAIRKLTAAHRFAELHRQQPHLSDRLYAAVIHLHLYSRDLALAQDPELPLESLVAYQDRIRKLDVSVTVTEAVDNYSRLAFLQTVCVIANRRIYNNASVLDTIRLINAKEEKVPFILKILTLMEFDFNETLIGLNERFDEIKSWSILPKVERFRKYTELAKYRDKESVHLETFDSLIGYFLGGPKVRGQLLARALAGGDLQNLEGPIWIDDKLRMRKELVDIGFSLERYHRAHGKYPEQLDKLTPDYLASVPEDWFNGEELSYEVVNGEYRLYSVGVNTQQRGKLSSGLCVSSKGWEWE